MVLAKKYFEVTDVQPLGGHKVKIAFNDGTARELDLAIFFLNPRPVFAVLSDPREFAKISINPVGGVCWENGADLGAEFLRDYTD